MVKQLALASACICLLVGPAAATELHEAPSLTALVAKGSLPELAQRMPTVPDVVKPTGSIGRYGGVLRTAFRGDSDQNAILRIVGNQGLTRWTPDYENVVPNVAESWTRNADANEYTFKLRSGMKWSDGQPFTADDVLFFVNDLLPDPQFFSSPPSQYVIDGKMMRAEKIDDTTMKLIFAGPYLSFPRVLATPLGQHPVLYEKHYCEQFVPKYNQNLPALLKQSGQPDWPTLFRQKCGDIEIPSRWSNVDRPTLDPWIISTPYSGNATQVVLRRNPYFWETDTAGNQLPYIDNIQFTLAEDLEVVNLRAIAGEYDWQARHIQLAKLPVLLQNQKARDYKVYLDPGTYGTDMQIAFNHSFQKDPEIAKWIGNVDFRRALSLAIDREELNQIFWLGIGQPRTIVPADDNPYNPGPEYSTMWSTHEPDKANAMLDKIGLTKKDSDGYRLRTDGKGRLTLEVLVYAASGMPYTQICELAHTHCHTVGIDLQVNEVERSLGEARIRSNEHQLMAWVGDGIDHLFSFPNTVLPMSAGALSGPLWGLWNASNGESGVKPDDWMVKVMDNYKRSFGLKLEERIPLVKEIWALLIDNVHSIGTVGLSPAFMGVRVVKNNMGNVPARQYNSPDVRTPSVSRVMSVYFKT